MDEPRHQLIRASLAPPTATTSGMLDYVDRKQHAMNRLTAVIDGFPSVPPREERAVLLEQGRRHLSERPIFMHISVANMLIDERHNKVGRDALTVDVEVIKAALHREIPKRGISPAVLYTGIERMFEAAIDRNVEWRPSVIPVLHYCKKVQQEAEAALIILDWPPTADERRLINYNLEFGLSIERDQRSRRYFGDERDCDDYDYDDGEPGPLDVARCREVEIKRYLHAAKAGLRRRAARRSAIACFDDDLRLPSAQELADYDVFVTIRDNPQRQKDINNFMKVVSDPGRARYLDIIRQLDGEDRANALADAQHFVEPNLERRMNEWREKAGRY
jgi:hypothetical protein